MARELDYFIKRAAQEREAATNAASPLARDAHLRMADGYDAIVKSSRAGGPSGQSELPVADQSR